jgi:hypothetical protein
MRRRVLAVTMAAVLGSTGTALAVTINLDPPDSQENGVSGVIETADTPWSGTNYDIRHVSAAGAGHLLVITTLTTDSHNDLGAHLVISSVNGDSWVAWWRDLPTDQVLVRKRNQATGAWAAERVQSVSTESCRRPSVVFDGTHAWIAYETTGTGGATILKAKIIEDDPTPFLAATAVATTSYAGTVQTRIQAESGHLWLSWVDSDTHVGWCRYDSISGIWDTPAFESYASDSVEAARERIRTSVLAN